MLEGTRMQEVFAALMRDIEMGKYAEGERLPSERELADMYHVSRDTVRKALQVLEAAGQIQRRAASGTYVSSRRAQNVQGQQNDRDLHIATRVAYAEVATTEASAAGEQLGAMFLILGDTEQSYFEKLRRPIALVPADKIVAGKLRLPPKSLVVWRPSLLMSEVGMHVAIMDSYYPVDQFGAAALTDIEQAVEEWLAARHTGKMERVTEHVLVRLPNDEERNLLRIGQLTQVLHVQRQAQDRDGHVLEYTSLVVPAHFATLRYDYSSAPRQHKKA